MCVFAPAKKRCRVKRVLDSGQMPRWGYHYDYLGRMVGATLY